MPFTVPDQITHVDVSFPVLPPGYDSLDDHEQAAAATEARRNALTYRFWTKALPGTEWEALEAAHPPHERGQAYNPETFGPAAISACVVDWIEGPANEIDALAKEAAAETGNRKTIDADEAAEIWGWPAWARARLFRHIEHQNLVVGVLLGK